MAWNCPIPGHPCMEGLEHQVIWTALESLLTEA
jgi:hypothetical protein